MIHDDLTKLTVPQLELLLENDPAEPWSSLPFKKHEPLWVTKKRLDDERQVAKEKAAKDSPLGIGPLDSASAHTCEPQERQPGETWGEYGARRGKNCPGCVAEEEAELNAGFIGIADDEFDIQTQKRSKQPKPGEFGTGRPAPMHQDDSALIQYLKELRDEGNIEGVTHKELCRAFHTCPPYDGQTYKLPIDDKFGKSPKIFGRQGQSGETFNKITGEPKPEFLQYYLDKENCKACRGLQGREENAQFCPNLISHEHGRSKPYCKEHIRMPTYRQSSTGMELKPSYPSEVDEMLGNLPKDFQDYERESRTSADSEFRDQIKKGLRVGDRVRMYFGEKGKEGSAGLQGPYSNKRPSTDTGRLIGKIMEIDREGAADRGDPDATHKVKWDNPKSSHPNWQSTWVDPYLLDAIGPHDYGYVGPEADYKVDQETKTMAMPQGRGPWPPPGGIGCNHHSADERCEHCRDRLKDYDEEQQRLSQEY